MVLVRRWIWSGSGSPKSSGEPAAPERARIRTIAHWKSIICLILIESLWAISILKRSPGLTFKHDSAQVRDHPASAVGEGAWIFRGLGDIFKMI